MKHSYLFILFFAILITANSQTISPRQSTEFCPNIEYTFTATITKPYTSITGIGGCYITQNPQSPVGTTFTFKGKFADANKKQTFQVNHPDGSSTPFEFRKIKSLFYSTSSAASPPCNLIMPNQTTLTVPRCQITNATISFSNIKWFTENETPELCFGNVTDYEYQLPAGWSIGVNISNGNNWIAGVNSVVVTSDVSSGDGMYIKIRASNKTCGTGLYANGPVSTIRISRPEPNLQIQSSQSFICAINGTINFNLLNLPTGASVVWSLNNNTDASISGPSNFSTVTIKRNTSLNTIVKLKAIVTDCSQSYSREQEIELGTGTEDFSFTNIYTTVNTGNGYPLPYFWGFTDTIPHAQFYNWYYKISSGGPGGGGGSFIYASTSYGPYNEITLPTCDELYIIKVEVVTPCGNLVTPLPEGFIYADCGSGFQMIVSPNPVKSLLNIKLIENDKKIEQYEIYTKMGNIVRKGAGNKGLNLLLNVENLKPDVYTIRVFDGKHWASKRFIVQ